MSKKYKVFIIAGEASGDTIGANFMSEFYNAHEVEFYGVGGEKMLAEGLQCIFPMSEISVMGFIEIIPHIKNIIKKINLTVKEIKRIEPDLVITIDSPDFNFRVVKKIQKLRPDCKFIHYVAPTVWAYREKRAKAIAKLYDHLFVLLPFEPEYFIKEGLETTFVGHPLVTHPLGERKKFLKDHKVPEDAYILCLSPGSRVSEVKKLFPIFIDAANIFISKFKSTYIVIPTFHNIRPYVEKYLSKIKSDKIIISHDRKDRKNAIAASNIALAKSGTITTELALNKVPMIVAYKINKISAFIVKKIIKTKFVSIINVILNKEVIPEYLQENCNKENLSEALISLASNESEAEKQLAYFEKAIDQLYNSEKLPPNKKAVLKTLELLQS